MTCGKAIHLAVRTLNQFPRKVITNVSGSEAAIAVFKIAKKQ